MNQQRLDNLKKFIDHLNNRWVPDGGPVSIKKIWDAGRKQWNLEYFSDYQWVVVLGKELRDEEGKNRQELFYGLTELWTWQDVVNYKTYNSVGTCPHFILDLDSGYPVYIYTPVLIPEKD